MRRWEYRTLVRNAYCDIAEELNTLGDDGWELVSIYASGRGGKVLVLKRPRAELKQMPRDLRRASAGPARSLPRYEPTSEGVRRAKFGRYWMRSGHDADSDVSRMTPSGHV
jgi:hypothetical protein